MGVLFTYTGAAAETIRKIQEDVKNPFIGRYYKHSRGWYWYVNSKGYYHVVEPIKVKFMDRLHFEIIDYLITKDNMMKESKRYGNFDSLEDCIKEIEKRWKNELTNKQ